MNILRKLRTVVALLFFIAVTLLFLDFTGTVHGWLGWLAKIQFFPALLALNAGVVFGLLLLTIAFGRVYCSVICPLGVFQDVVARTKRVRNKYSHSPALSWLRYGMLSLFIVAFLVSAGSVVALLEPYSAYGRIASNFFAPLYQWGNNLLAYLAQRVDSYAFYSVEVWMKSLGTFLLSAATLVALVVLAWRGGRTYCNTICPVGTILGLLSKISIYKHRIDTEQCNSCGLCARNCKASCINSKEHSIDYSRCVSCFNCIDKCSKGAIRYQRRKKKESPAVVAPDVSSETVDSSRRDALAIVGALVVGSTVKAQEKKVDGGLAFIEDKKIPKRQTPIAPPGSMSIRHFAKHCTGCQLCVAVCPNQVLRPSASIASFMQPEMSYERGYCRPECVKCSEVCPAGAFHKITVADKSAIQVGHAVWIRKNCVVVSDDVDCDNCAHHCPVGAISMMAPDSGSRKTPVVNVERCIGCGACENLCPARPFSAIYVEGHSMHRTV